jgi:hypothetical protein
MIQKEINYQEFVGVIYDSNKSNEYFNFWHSDLSELDLTHEQKIDLANGWQYITIYYANNEERLKEEYYTYTENLYWIVYDFIKKYNKHIYGKGAKRCKTPCLCFFSFLRLILRRKSQQGEKI